MNTTEIVHDALDCVNEYGWVGGDHHNAKGQRGNALCAGIAFDDVCRELYGVNVNKEFYILFSNMHGKNIIKLNDSPGMTKEGIFAALFETALEYDYRYNNG